MRLEDRLKELVKRASAARSFNERDAVLEERRYLLQAASPALGELLRASRQVIADVEEYPQISPISTEFNNHWQDFLAALAACDSIP